MPSYRILIIDDEDANLESLARIVRSDGGEPICFQDPEKAMQWLKPGQVDLVLTDLRMRPIGGLEVLKLTKQTDPQVDVILITAFGTVELAVQAMRQGAYDFITKPLQRLGVLAIVHRALEKRQLINENQSLREELQEHLGPSGREILGKSQAMQQLIGVVEQSARSRANVFIHGESGTGKGLLAEYIHQSTGPDRGLFVHINCAALPDNLLEAELFGYEAGAFTGAQKRKKGRVELAHHGTLFLDEIGIAPMSLQTKLLRFLQSGEFERLGSNETLRVQARVISATNGDISSAIRQGTFREDLYYRLNVINIRVPSLRERREDIALLAQRFMEVAAKKNNRAVPLLHADALASMVEYDWPGNIRELQNVLERMVVLSRSGVLTVVDLPPEIAASRNDQPATLTIPLGLSLREVERLMMDEVLKVAHGDKKQAARLLGVHPRTVHRYLESTQQEGGPDDTF